MLHRDKEERNIIHRKNIRNGHILHRNCLLNDVVEGKIERTVKRGSRGKHILGELIKEASRSWNLQEEALAHLAHSEELGLEETMDLS